MKLNELSPSEVFSYFGKICSIPHGSGNTGMIADYCLEFAKLHGLKARKDAADNVVIFKAGSSGYEDCEPVILQGHLDMVCEKEPDCDIDMSVQSINACTDGKMVWADGTTLGADDGIAVAFILAVLASLLSHASCEADFRLVSLSGGGKENAIPKEAKAVVSVRSCDVTTFEQSIKESADVWMQEISATEPHAKIEVEKTDAAADKVLDSHSTANVIYALQLSPDGVYKMSQEIKGMVQTSLNLGTAYLDADKLVYKYLIRSNTAAGKKLLLERVTTFVKHLSGKVVTMSDYPAWEYKSDSQLRKICVESFTNVYGHEPEVTSIHAGLECGILAGKMPGVDMISFGPTLESVHTPDECMDVASVERTWEYLLEILKEM